MAREREPSFPPFLEMRLWLLIAIVTSLSGAAFAQPADEFGDLSRDASAGTVTPAAAGQGTAAGGPAAGGRQEGGKPLEVQSIAGSGIDFQPGRDNLGFANLSGAMRLGGMAGNCYTMAFVAKLFFEEARFFPSDKPDALRAGFTLAELATHLGGSNHKKLGVRDFQSLFEMSWDPSFAEDEAFAYLAKQRGIQMGVVEEPSLSGKRKMILQLMQIISTIHYLHYMQYQAGSFVEAVLRQKLAGSKQIQDLTRREVASMATKLGSGKTCLLLMLHVKEIYGHVVLAYRIVKTAEADYVYVYDSNVQYGQEIRPSVLKIGRDGKVAGYFRQEANGTLTPDGIYDGDSWFSGRDNLAIIDLPYPKLDSENMKTLARKTAVADDETAYLMAGGQLLKSLTERSPQQSSMRADTLQFLRNVQAIQSSTGRKFFDETQRLPEDADVKTINRFLEKNADIGIRTAFPYALPKGVSLTGTRVVLDERDPNKGFLATTLTLDKDGPVHHLAGVLERSAALSQYPVLSRWIAATRENVGPTKIRAEIEVDLTKKRLPAGFKTTYGPLPVLRKSHVVLGDIEPSPKLGPAHQLEISKAVLQGGLATALSHLEILGKDFEFEYILVPAKFTPVVFGRQAQLTPEKRRKGRVRLTGLGLDLLESPGRVRLVAKVESFVACNPLRDGLGVSGATDPLNVDLRAYRGPGLPAGQWRVRGDVAGRLQFADGLFNLLSTAVTRLADKVFPFVRGKLNAYIREELSHYVKLLEPFGVYNLSLSTKWLAFDTGDALLDLDALAQQLFSFQSPVILDRFEVRRDRVLIGTDYK